MWMEHQGKKATHDFLSLHNKDPSFPLQDPRPPTNKGFLLRTYDFLQPLERGGGGEEARPGPKEGTAASVSHVLPGGIGTYSISHVSEPGSRVAVKTEGGTCANSGNAYAGVDLARCDQPGSIHAGASPTDTRFQGPWPSPIAVRRSFGSLSSSSRNHPSQLRKPSMERASGFDDDDDDEEYSGKRDSSSHRGEFAGKADGKNGADQRPSTPRSKHSATEQRRRSKINDRFQILRELIPHSDQKRDKASFLLEVIEYIRFLQERVQKYEPSYPGWTEENAKGTPWVNVYFRSFWKNARNRQGPGDDISDPSQVLKNGSPAAGFIFSGNDDSAPLAPALLSAAPNPSESDMSAGLAYKAAEFPPVFASKATASASVGGAQSGQLISDADNVASQSHPQWLRSPFPTDCTVTGDALNEHEELAIDEGTISVSSNYSQGLLATLSQALESSGIDLSQASVSVNINLGKRATNRRPSVTTTMSSAKDHDPSLGTRVIGHPTVGSNGEESEQASKRHKSDSR